MKPINLDVFRFREVSAAKFTDSRRNWLGILVVSAFTVMGSANAQTGEGRAYERAVTAAKQGNTAAYTSEQRNIKSVYLKNLAYGYYLNNNTSKVSYEDVQKYVDGNRALYTSRQVRHTWLNKVMNARQWQAFDALFDMQIKDPQIRCTWIDRRGKDYEPTADVIEALWLTTDSRPDDCNKIFSKWRQQNELNDDLVWQRILLAADNNMPKLTGFISDNYQNEKDRRIVDAWTKARYTQSGAEMARLMNIISEHKDEDIARSLISSLYDFRTRHSPEKAYQLWVGAKASSKAVMKWEPDVLSAVASRAVLNEDRDAKKWLSLTPALNDEVAAEVAVRLYLREYKWNDVLKTIQKMHSEIRQKVDWQYWLARAKEQTGDKNGAKSIYESIASDREYYSFLAADKLDWAYNFRNEPPSYGQQDKIAAMPSFQAVRALLDNGLTGVARAQWIYATAEFDEIQLASAAKLASDWGFHDRAIITAGSAKIFDAIDIRFPLAYLPIVEKAAKQNNVAPEFVFGIIRQESAFMDQVRSHAGAMGLMQILPSTGREIAAKTGISNFSENDLLQPEKNIPMGSWYIASRLREFKNQYPVAIASYNAGPGNARRWLPNNRIDSDIWVETITFRETRKYVKRVLEYTMVYRHLMGKKQEKISNYLKENVVR